MASIANDYTRKIQFAESWLKKAKEEFEQGSELSASSHIILAIAEMEALKRSLFDEPELVELPERKPRYIRFDLRPIVALGLLFIALSIFNYSINVSQNQIPVGASNEIVESSNVADLAYMNGAVRQPAIEPVIERLDSLINQTGDTNENVIDNIPLAPKNPIASVKPKTRAKSPVKTSAVPSVSNEQPISDRSETSVAGASSEKTETLVPEEIQIKAILAARESLNIEE